MVFGVFWGKFASLFQNKIVKSQISWHVLIVPIMYEWGKVKHVPGSKIATIIYYWKGCEFLKIDYFPIFKVLEEFGEDLEEPRSDKIYSSENQVVKKGPGPWKMRNGELLVPSLHPCKQCTYYNLHFWMWDLKNLILTGSNRWDSLKPLWHLFHHFDVRGKKFEGMVQNYESSFANWFWHDIYFDIYKTWSESEFTANSI